MSVRIRTTALVAVAFLAGVFAAGGVGFAQNPCVTQAPPVTGEAPSIAVSQAIEWFKAQGIDDMESISSGSWSAMDTSGHGVPVASIVGTDDLTYLSVNQSALDPDSTWQDLDLLQATVDRFVPAASAWFADALATTPPGSDATGTFGKAEITYQAVQVVGSPMGIVTITFE